MTQRSSRLLAESQIVKNVTVCKVVIVAVAIAVALAAVAVVLSLVGSDDCGLLSFLRSAAALFRLRSQSSGLLAESQ
ncbi:MAG: hypothetical protein VX683_00415, partial [Cyanobacteriota bacterium]|nr:hypothetical protein [Cyanobacteriota bacterium]